MSKPKSESGKEPPRIRFGDDLLPAHDVWHKMETVNVVVDAIDRFNQKFPELASATTRDVVPLVRQRLKDIELHMPYKGSQADLAELAVNLLSSMSPEEVIDTLEQEHGARIGIVDLIQLAGDAAYRAALSREATEYELNRISPQQAADLWNDLGRPAPGGGLWNAAKVQALLLLKPD
ncbi:MAG: hypothetical protein H6953_10025 [Chromatiaceae bacterium]|nr:hypothetical protein [Gammaproteobacteria bacterium]MCP5305774.1 hypothetical protein [Chromatiaceae bacterium]MCP5312631.1 hypothetical protein [Chromatiaceae bacterium]